MEVMNMGRGLRKEKIYDVLMTNDLKEKVIDSITEYSPAQVEKNGPETRNGVVVKSLFVNLRKEPSFGSEVCETVRMGDKVTIHSIEGEFYKVSTDKNSVAYISSEFVEEV